MGLVNYTWPHAAVEAAPPRGVRGEAAQAAVRLISRPPISHFTPPGLCHPLRGTGEWKKYYLRSGGSKGR